MVKAGESQQTPPAPTPVNPTAPPPQAPTPPAPTPPAPTVKPDHSTTTTTNTNTPSSGASSDPNHDPKHSPPVKVQTPKSKNSKKSRNDLLLSKICQIELQDSRVFDTCDEVREKAQSFITLHKCSRASFLRALCQNNAVKPNSWKAFVGFKGEFAGANNRSYYLAYFFLEKLRVLQGEPKSKSRTDSEKSFPQGRPFTHSRDEEGAKNPNQVQKMQLSQMPPLATPNYQIPNVVTSSLAVPAPTVPPLAPLPMPSIPPLASSSYTTNYPSSVPPAPVPVIPMPPVPTIPGVPAIPHAPIPPIPGVPGVPGIIIPTIPPPQPQTALPVPTPAPIIPATIQPPPAIPMPPPTIPPPQPTSGAVEALLALEENK
ncbi:hypothetical protein TrLO_g14296 [Triparma laevis f. longispina]|uniref:DUF7726 domain-containing protein n=1 Tax=Triparma laevis f. longispina TaxID=1714387 RepID=A0A9W7FAQ1_9STRA|nr:hypothetical protein TrLO_g14296 [Triparma laevis f. longispina]